MIKSETASSVRDPGQLVFCSCRKQSLLVDAPGFHAPQITPVMRHFRRLPANETLALRHKP
jgi:hypothetical protein